MNGGTCVVFVYRSRVRKRCGCATGYGGGHCQIECHDCMYTIYQLVKRKTLLQNLIIVMSAFDQQCRYSKK